jgi:hypothetical protein
MHQPYGAVPIAITVGTTVKIDPLDERTGAVAYADYGDTNFSHAKKEILPAA